ncbi:complement C1q-like protein 2 [Engraulis encrasicolus]|uniref:complement C1q-like protein 2 n=1 Tax=Engraulis encrasicolus TaxID=184585 RepID=UPI002FD364D4
MMELALEETVASLKSKLESSQKLVEEQHSQMKELKERQEQQASQLKELRQHHQDARVSFSASLLESGSGSTGPFDEKTILKYEHVITNIGGAYDSDTGVFKAPVKGVYLFSVHALGPGHDSTGTGVCLYKNDEQVLTAWSRQPQERVAVSNSVSLLLEKGDEVCVKLWPNSWVYDNDNHLSTFSGHLLFPM